MRGFRTGSIALLEGGEVHIFAGGTDHDICQYGRVNTVDVSGRGTHLQAFNCKWNFSHASPQNRSKTHNLLHPLGVLVELQQRLRDVVAREKDIAVSAPTF